MPTVNPLNPLWPISPANMIFTWYFEKMVHLGLIQKVLFWHFYFQDELVIHGEKKKLLPRNITYSRKCLGNLGFCCKGLQRWFVWYNGRLGYWVCCWRQSSWIIINLTLSYTDLIPLNAPMFKCPYEEKKITEKEIHRTKSANYIKTQNDCKFNGEVLIEIDPLGKTLVFG